LLALDDGICITGSFRQAAFTTGTLSVTAGSFLLVPPSFSCAGAGPEIVAAFSNSPSSFDILHADIVVNYDGTLPTFFCGVVPLNDPLGVFPANSVTPDYPKAPLTLEVHPPIPPRTITAPEDSRAPLIIPAICWSELPRAHGSSALHRRRT
jgi:hypothetical protein